MKYLILIPDGMADRRIDRIKGTPLEVSEHPNMDQIAREGACGIAKTIPDGFEAGSDVANLTILGIDVKKYYTGRGPIEALSKGIEAKAVFRCNLVKVSDDVLLDYSGGRISDDEARDAIRELNKQKKWEFIKFYAGKSYRNLMTVDLEIEEVKTFAPHDIQGKKISEHLPKGEKTAELLKEIMFWSKGVLESIECRANMVWLWGGGKMPNFPKIKMRGAMITEVDLLKGIARGLGLDFVEVEGVTGYIDTNYRGLVRATLRSLEKYDLVILHTEGIDEVSHEGDVEKKIEAIEVYDEKVVGKILDNLEENVRIMLIPDHATPIELKTHSSDPVPFAIHGVKRDDVKRFDEFSCAKGRFGFVEGIKLMEILLS
ncbi:MAG: cofactor-independent phosphoglycerate mutase [Archaeoglobaceae archaeon]|nr:cofactor-independent phosphoglycerate mutase [Archaeoglobaceae archaeon]MCX8152610.1 cofactor-independent phosphoglycerate mutase [Archaeoglobaceae archaeon]MDW8014108.1 cofactor-independent phosphoglycerate mutase [Archaeoglobaceae archaeon]